MTATKPKNTGETPKRRKRGASPEGSRREPMRVLVLHPVIREAPAAAVPEGESAAIEAVSPEAALEEAVGLAQAIELDVVQSGVVRIARPRPATLFGSGKVEEMRGLIEAEAIGLVIVDHPLSPVQQRNLEKAWNAKILDRTGLILEIFGARARTKEGRLQVELAHLLYQRSRLVRSWTHLERQRGGFGFLGGPGETQIEADRRVIGERIDAIRKDLAGVRRTRRLHREGRKRTPFPTVALAGYTNAGKSTLFNALTRADVFAEDQLFATLDPTMRRLDLASGEIIISDTVGFISDLPTTLIAAFRATLEEVSEADLILHVRDMATPFSAQQRQDVEEVLGELDVDTESHDSRIIEVWNKIDLLGDEERQGLAAQASRQDRPAVPVSARSGEGLEALKQLISERLARGHVVQEFDFGAKDGALIHWLYRHGEVRSRREDEDGHTHIEARLTSANLERFRHLQAQSATRDGV